MLCPAHITVGEIVQPLRSVGRKMMITQKCSVCVRNDSRLGGKGPLNHFYKILFIAEMKTVTNLFSTLQQSVMRMVVLWFPVVGTILISCLTSTNGEIMSNV